MADTSIILNKIKWDIKEVPENDNALDGNRGYCYYRTSTIYLLERLKPSEKLLHYFMN